MVLGIRLFGVAALPVLWLVCLCGMLGAKPAKKPEDARLIVGTWSSGSRQVSTGKVGGDKQFTVPKAAGISYSFTEDGYFEMAKVQYESNSMCDPTYTGLKPECFEAKLIWQHGTYKSDAHTIDMYPYKGDGAVQTINNCKDKNEKVQMQVYSDNWSTYVESQPAFLGDTGESVYSMQLYGFDGAPYSKLYLTFDPPNMLDTQQIFRTVIGADT